MKNLSFFACLLGAMLCLSVSAKAQEARNTIRLNTLNLPYKGIGIAYERETFKRQSILAEYSQANFRGWRGTDGWFDTSNSRWNWKAVMLEYRFYVLDGEAIEHFNIYIGIYARYASNISQQIMSEATTLYGKNYQAGDAHQEIRNNMLGGGLTSGYAAQLSPRIKFEMGVGSGLMRVLKETVRDDLYEYVRRGQPNSQMEQRGAFRWNPRFMLSVGYCF